MDDRGKVHDRLAGASSSIDKSKAFAVNENPQREPKKEKKTEKTVTRNTEKDTHAVQRRRQEWPVPGSAWGTQNPSYLSPDKLDSVMTMMIKKGREEGRGTDLGGVGRERDEDRDRKTCKRQKGLLRLRRRRPRFLSSSPSALSFSRNAATRACRHGRHKAKLNLRSPRHAKRHFITRRDDFLPLQTPPFSLSSSQLLAMTEDNRQFRLSHRE
ncbi:hypothetical protein GW17_00017463 [Ensete ventricosum]|nr:hypothetical protein GW17_00017463 [Ensete ventricosum]